jgi:plastocyanin
MRLNRTALVAGTLLAGTLLAACGDDDDAATDVEEQTEQVAAESAAVTIERSRFEPDELTVAVGTEVTWENLDAFSHTVTSDEESSLAFDSGDMAEGDTFAQTFDEAGTYEYFCEVHPTMRSTVVVE